MRLHAWIGLALLGTAFAASAQRPDCPLKNAPVAMTPPGPPPAFVPPPPTFDKSGNPTFEIPPPVVLPAQDGPTRVEEGHLSAVASLAERARPELPPADVQKGLIDQNKTGLSAWRLRGYIPDPAWKRPPCDPKGNCSTSGRHRVERVFSKDGSTLLLTEWNMAADGAAVVATAPQTLRIGRSLGSMNAMVSPSGCASASISWQGEGKSTSLQVVGPKSLDEQQDLLLELAGSVAKAYK